MYSCIEPCKTSTVEYPMFMVKIQVLWWPLDCTSSFLSVSQLWENTEKGGIESTWLDMLLPIFSFVSSLHPLEYSIGTSFKPLQTTHRLLYHLFHLSVKSNWFRHIRQSLLTPSLYATHLLLYSISLHILQPSITVRSTTNNIHWYKKEIYYTAYWNHNQDRFPYPLFPTNFI